ncbi:hypothetical protein [Saccharopolyspora taberi]|uniref:Uncharacterized protein n=1 Tax=Saccharopolyspora taberi TaxID=60895 RepID=A0ABN3VPM8_9PSEU
MEAWRFIATALTVAVGSFMVLGLMANVRARRETGAREVARTGVRGGLAVAVVAALTATVLPPVVCWSLVGAGALVTSIVMITG